MTIEPTSHFDNLVDYSNGVFVSRFTQGGSVYYATFRPEIVSCNQSLERTGRYIVNMLHPHSGEIEFYLRYFEGTWILDSPSYNEEPQDNGDHLFSEYSFLLEEELIDWCRDMIDYHNA